ncbi:34543_t:CDS:10 [Gigaspora margarita]|uniref:34543_t:CDS:1 n=1 Tax=Gigaspora margarita TaxID=4874 RepID=A0ABM8VX20_GIGMA|nr:34543_t:CDS:10 [Gigaspora margarita]
MQLIPECLNALKYRTFWENTEEPTLFDFLNFRLSTGVLDDKRTEYSRYKNELTTISKFYAEASEFGQNIIKWKNSCKSLSAPTTLQPVMLAMGKSVMPVAMLNELLWTCHARKEFNDKRSKVVNNFWDCQDINAEAEMVEIKSKAEIRMFQAAQHATIAKVTTEQVQQYAVSTTTGIAKRFLDNNEETTNHVKAYKTNSEKIDHDCNADETNHGGENSTMDNFEKQKHTDESIIKKNGFRTPPHQIVGNTYFSSSFQSIMVPSNENILKALAKSLATINDSKYFKDFIPRFLEFKEYEKNNEYSCAHDDVMDIRGDSDFAKFLTLDEYMKLLLIKPKRNETTEHGLKKQISDWINITKELNVIKNEDSEESIKLKEYGVESFNKPIPDISASNTSERHYWSEFGHRFFSKMLQDFVGLDWRVMEAPVMASKYRKNYGLNYAKDKIAEGKFADLLAWLWETGEEIFVGEQAGPPNQHDLTKLSMDSFKLYRKLRDCLNVRILHSIEKGDTNYNNRIVFGILGYLFEIKMVIMWKDGVYIYEEFGSLKIASHPNNIPMMKSGMLRLLEFRTIIKSEVQNTLKVEYNHNTIQFLKRKFNDIIQTKSSPSKIAKSLIKLKITKKKYKVNFSNDTSINVELIFQKGHNKKKVQKAPITEYGLILKNQPKPLQTLICTLRIPEGYIKNVFLYKWYKPSDIYRESNSVEH